MKSNQNSEFAMAPTGNGAVYGALESSGILAELEKRGVRTVHQYAVDNVLALPVDPVVVGAMEEDGSDLLVKCVRVRKSAVISLSLFLCIFRFSFIIFDAN